MSEYEANIRDCMTIILGTKPGERQMLPEFGCRVHELMFAPNTNATAALIARHVKEALGRWEPRIEVEEVDAFPDANGQIRVQIHYKIRSTSSPQELSLLLTAAGRTKMPIKPPNLDDRRYADIIREARELIPQYTPEWTNLGDADPGMTLVQLFAWMTEMTIYRLNRVPDKTYIHFLNFIGEERREARPAVVPVTFELRVSAVEKAELPAYARVSTRAGEGVDAIHYLTTEPITVHDANITRIVSVQAGTRPLVREVPFAPHPTCAKALLFGGGRGVQTFKMDSIDDGPRSYTPHHYVYVGHDDFRLMDFEDDGELPIGRMVVRSAGDANLPVGAMFHWEYYTGDDKQPWLPVRTDKQEEEVLGLPEIGLLANMPGLDELDAFGHGEDTFPYRKRSAVITSGFAVGSTTSGGCPHRMVEDLEIAWRDDRGGEDRPLNNWEVRATGRALEFFVQDMPPIRGGWTVSFSLVDRSVPAGRGAYLPMYRWSYRRGDQWEPIPAERVRYQDTTVVLTGPFTDMAGDGYNLRAERAEVVHTRGFIPDLDLEMTWLRPVVLHLAAGPETAAAGPVDTTSLPTLPSSQAPRCLRCSA